MADALPRRVNPRWGGDVGNNWRSSSPVLGCVLECLRELEHAPIVTRSPNDLQPDRETLWGESGRHRDRGMTGDRDPRARPHPFDIRRHSCAVDFGRVWLVGGKRRKLRHGQQEKLVGREELDLAPVERGTKVGGAANVWSGEGAALLDVPDHRVLQLIAMTVEQHAIAPFEITGPKRFKHLIGASEVGFSLHQVDPEIGENAPLRLEHVSRATIDRQSAQITAPGHSDPAKVACQRTSEGGSGLLQRNRRAQIGSGNDAHHQCHVADRARQRAVDRHVEPRRL